MGFGLQARDVPRMHTYADAVRVYERIRPDRYEVRHLSRNKDLTIGRNMDGTIVCSYHGNQVVTYRPDNTMLLRACGWHTPSTGTFIQACAGIRTTLHRDTLYARVDNGLYIVDNLELDAERKPINPTRQTRRVLDKDKAKQARAPMQPYIKQLLTALKAMDALAPSARYREALPTNLRIAGSHYMALNFLRRMAVGTDEDKEMVTNWLLWQAAFAVEARGNKHSPRKNVQLLLREMLKELYIEEGCVVEELVPLGELPKPNWT